MSFTRISIMVLLAAVVVYFGLTYLFPHQKDTAAVAAGATTDQVFGATTATTPAPASPDTAAVAAAAENPASTATDAPKESATTASSTSPASQSATSEAAAAPSASDSAAATSTPAVVADTAKPAITEEPAKLEPAQPASAPTETASSMPSSTPQSTATDTASSGSSSEASTMAGADSSTTSLTASPPKHHRHVRPSTEPTAAPSNSGQAVAVKESTATHSEERRRRREEVKDDVATAWWPDVSTRGSQQLSLEYAGEANFAKAIVLLFNSDLGDAAAAGSHIHVFTVTGKEVPSKWVAGHSARMLVLPVSANGRYTVVLGPELADASGKALGSRLFGPVYIR